MGSNASKLQGAVTTAPCEETGIIVTSNIWLLGVAICGLCPDPKISDPKILFEELESGLKDVKAFEEEKITLKTMTIKPQERKVLEADEIRAIRDKYHMSRAVFANFLHISTRTLEKWELGTSRPNEQATTLLALTDMHPDMLERLKRVQPYHPASS